VAQAAGWPVGSAEGIEQPREAEVEFKGQAERPSRRRKSETKPGSRAGDATTGVGRLDSSGRAGRLASGESRRLTGKQRRRDQADDESRKLVSKAGLEG